MPETRHRGQEVRKEGPWEVQGWERKDKHESPVVTTPDGCGYLVWFGKIPECCRLGERVPKERMNRACGRTEGGDQVRELEGKWGQEEAERCKARGQFQVETNQVQDTAPKPLNAWSLFFLTYNASLVEICVIPLGPRGFPNLTNQQH